MENPWPRLVLHGIAHRRASLAVVLGVTLSVLAGCDTSGNEARQRIAEGVQYAANGQQLEAVRRLEEGVALDPNNGQGHYFLGLLRLQHYQDPGGAVTSLERAVALMPDDVEARYQLGVALNRLDRHDAAASTFAEVVALDPNHSGALYRLGLYAEADDEIRDAIDYFTRAIYADPYLPMAYNALGNVYLRFEAVAEATQVFQNGIDNCPETADRRVGNALNRGDLGRAFMAAGDLDAAIDALRAAAEMDSARASVHLNLGVALAQRYGASGSASDRDAATEALSRARAQCNPSTEQARCNSIASALRDLRAADAAE